MRDELEDEDLTTDPSTRKKATDWLMQVISARKPINLSLNNLAYEEDGEVAVAVRDDFEEPETVKWTGEISAEDLCGAPAIPVVRAEPAAPPEKIDITADDVCWVPQERRLKPEPMVEPAPRILQMVQPGRENQPQPEVIPPEPRKSPAASMSEGFFGKTALAADPATNHLSVNDGVSIDDISREPAPYVVEPIWNSFSGTFLAPEADQGPVTEADICRDWMIESAEPAQERGKDGVVLPFSFKVLKSQETEAAEQSAAAESALEIATEVEHPPAAVADSEVNQVTLVEEAAEVAAPPETAAPTKSEAVDAQPEIASVVKELPVADVPAEVLLETEPLQAEAETLEAEADLPEPESATLEEPQEEIAAETKDERPPESVFAHEGFWKDSVPGVIAAEDQPVEVGSVIPLNDEMAPLSMDGNHPAQAAEDAELGTKRPEEFAAAWKAVLGSVLPWMARSLPALEAGGGLTDAAGAPGEVRQDLAGLRLVQYEIRTTVQDHSLHLKRMDEQLGRIRESMESRASDSAELVEGVKSMTKLVRLVGAGLGGLLVVLIVLVAILLAH